MKTSAVLLTTLMTFTLAELALAGRQGNNGGCRYKRSPWGDCHETSNEQSKTLTLKPNQDETCEATKTITRKCKAACKYNRGDWTNCTDDGQKTMTMTLKKGDRAQCEATQTKTKPCKGTCKYSREAGGQCVNGSKTITKTLEEGDPAVCQQTVTKQKKCGGARKGGRRNRNQDGNQDTQ